MDKAKFYAIVMGKNKSELQDMLLKLAPAAYRIAADIADLEEDGTLMPADKQYDDDVKAILKVTGI